MAPKTHTYARLSLIHCPPAPLRTALQFIIQKLEGAKTMPRPPLWPFRQTPFSLSDYAIKVACKLSPFVSPPDNVSIKSVRPTQRCCYNQRVCVCMCAVGVRYYQIRPPLRPALYTFIGPLPCATIL